MFRRGVARFLAVILCVVAPGLMVLPASVAADPVVEGVITFADVPDSSMFYKEISWLAAEGISTGWDVGGGVREYRPLQSIARDAMAAFLYRKAGSPAYTPPASSPFTDVAPGAAFYKEITWLASKGISTGWDVGGGMREYRPLNPIARDAMAAFLFRFAQPGEFTAPPQSPFTDVTTGAAFYREITWLASAGISTGWDVGGGLREYRPLIGIARDAMAAFLYRYSATKVPSNPLDPTGGTVTLAPEVQLLQPAALDAAQVSGSAITLPSTNAQNIHPNDVLVAGITPSTPDGLLVRVTEVSRDPAGPTTLTTQPATLPEAVVSTPGLIDVSGIPESSTFVPEADVTTTTAAAPQVAPQALSAQADIFSQSFKWEKTQKAELGSSTLSGSGSVSVSTTVTAAAKARMTLDTSFLKLKETSVVVTPSLSAKHEQKFSGSLKGTISAPLGTLWAKFRFMVGPVPVIVTADLKIKATLSAEGAAEVTYTSSNTVSSDHGMKYKDGSFSLINTKPVSTVTDKTVQATSSLTARASLDFDATIKFYGVAGITFGAGPYASAAIAVTTTDGVKTWSCPLEFGHETRVGVVAGIEILGLKAEWRDITTATWKLAEANPCEGTPVTSPAPNPTPTPTPTPTPSPTPTPTAPTPFPAPSGLTNVKTILSSGLTAYAIKTDGTVWSWGANFYGQLGNGTTNDSSTPAQISGLTGVTSLTASADTAYALLTDGTVQAWGWSGGGQLGNGTTTNSSTPVQVTGLTGVQSISTSGDTTYALLQDGTLRAWGSNAFGELGDGTTIDSSSPVQVTGLTGVTALSAAGHTAFALLKDGTVRAWGSNWNGELGNGTNTNSNTPVQVIGLTNVAAVTASGDPADGTTAYALLKDQSVRAWGWNRHGQLGDGTTTNSSTPVQVTGLVGVTALSATPHTTYALLTDGAVRAWGDNYFGQLGNGSTTDSSTPVQVTGLTSVTALAAAPGAAYALMKDGTVFAWGANDYGELGSNTTSRSSILVQVTGLTGVTALSVGYYGWNAHALMSDGTVRAWGYNASGQLGNGTTADSSVPVQVGVTAGP